jgi:hypothetical protein
MSQLEIDRSLLSVVAGFPLLDVSQCNTNCLLGWSVLVNIQFPNLNEVNEGEPEGGT